MSKSYDNAGAPTLQAAREFLEVNDAAQVAEPVIVDLQTVNPAAFPRASQAQLKEYFLDANSGKFPIRPVPHDPYDKIYDIKRGLIQTGAVSSARPLPIDSADINYIKNKAAAEELAGYQAWIGNRFRLDDPATNYWFQGVAPSYYDQKAETIDSQIDLSSAYAKIRLRGPQNEDDLKLQWMISTGRLKLPKGAPWDPLENELREAGVAANDNIDRIQTQIATRNKRIYEAGLFSPIKAITPQPAKNSPNNKMPAGANLYNRADIKGSEATRFVGIPLGALPPDVSNIGELYSGPNLGFTRRGEQFLTDQRYNRAVYQNAGNQMVSQGGSIRANLQAAPNLQAAAAAAPPGAGIGAQPAAFQNNCSIM